MLNLGDVVKAKIIRYPKGDYIAEGRIKRIVARAGDKDQFILSQRLIITLNHDFSNRVNK